MYPPLRVFDVVSKTASFTLPDESVAHPSPYLYFDSTGGAIDATVDGDAFVYAAELVFVKLAGADLMSIVAPNDWVTPGATELPSSDVAPSGSSWRVLIDGVNKVVTVLTSSPGGSGTTQQGTMFKFHGAIALSGGGAVTGYIADAIANSASVTALGYPMPRNYVFTDLYINIHDNTANQPVSVTVRKNNNPTALTIPLIPGGTTGVTHIGSVSVSFAVNDLLDLEFTSSAAGAGNFSAACVLFGAYTP